ncbi:MAG: HAMP domain-containing histidine kinase [Gemmatimonadota bacterium]|nr:HAMP domain-containing histidine kinase [Gemmatimonadota bacterium]
MRRGVPELVVGLLFALLLTSYIVFTQQVVRDLQGEGKRTSEMYARVFRAQIDTTESASTQALFDLSRSIREEGVPLVVTDRAGVPTSSANIATDIVDNDSLLRAYIRDLDGLNPPVVDSIVGQIHYGNPPIIRWLHIIPALQAASALVLVLAAAYIVRTRGNAERERVWAGMARESAHQLGTPLSSLSGWIELLEERGVDEPTQSALTQMQADLVRLDRVAHRFERIGREPRRDTVDVAALVERLASYFRQRVPTLKHEVTIEVIPPESPFTVRGDAVLLEWSLEVLVKNAVDALAGRGGRILLTTAYREGGGARVTVSDDGPGIPRELRGRIFDPGYTTKSSGWGIGLSLARRIIEENHAGTLRLASTDRGASFEIILP